MQFLLPSYAQSSEDTIVYSWGSHVGPLNPHAYSPNQMFAQEMVYEALVRVDEAGEVQPWLAQRWRVSADGLTYTFYLRPGVRFSDGEVFNAQAVVKNFDAIMANKSNHSWLAVVEKIESYKAVDDLTFEIRLSVAYYPVLEDFSLPRPFRFLSPKAFGEDGMSAKGIRKAVGTGPWQLVETRLGEYDRFDRNDLYWGVKPEMAHVLVKVISDPTARAVALNTGEIDMVYGVGQISYSAFHVLTRSPKFVTKVSKPMGGMTLAINTQKTPTNELAVRQALQHAVDKEAIIRSVFFGTQTQADTLFSPDVPYCNVGLEPYAFDPEKARLLLDGAGWVLPAGGRVRQKGGQMLEIVYYYIGNDAAEKAIAEILQAQFAQIGVRLLIVGEEANSFSQRQKDGSFGMISNQTWGPPFEPHAMLGSMRESSHADYQAQLGLPMKAQIDESITQVLQTQDEQVRQELYRQILTTLHEQAVYLPVFYSSQLLVYRKGSFQDVYFGGGQTHIPFENIRK